MPTLADLRARIVRETNRSDLQDVLASALDQAISDAISDYANERFWFNETRVTGTFSAGQQYTQLPSGQYLIDKVFVTIGSVNMELTKKTNAEIEGLYLITQTGQPMLWAPYGMTARLWPTPPIDYPSIWLTVSDALPLLVYDGAGASSNAWTNQGQWLICARAKCFLYQNVFRDPDALAGAQADLENAYENLKGQSNKQLATGRMRASW